LVTCLMLALTGAFSSCPGWCDPCNYFIDRQGQTIKALWGVEPVNQGFSQGLVVVAALRPTRKMGFMDKDGQWFIQPTFTEARDFSEDLAAVAVEQKWGFVNREGKWAIRPSFASARSFSEGLAAVAVTRGYDATKWWGFIDKQGQWVVQPSFGNVTAFSEGLAGAEVDRKWGFIDKSGKWVIQPAYSDVGTTRPCDHLFHGLRDGVWEDTRREVIAFSEGLTAAYDEHDGRWGFINKDGRWVIQPQFIGAGGFSDGLAAVEAGGLWGFVDRSGNWVVTPFSVEAHGFTDGVAAVEYRGTSGFIDKAGKWEIGPGYQQVHAFSDGLAAVSVNR